MENIGLGDALEAANEKKGVIRTNFKVVDVSELSKQVNGGTIQP